jgi:hypothetical protein
MLVEFDRNMKTRLFSCPDGIVGKIRTVYIPLHVVRYGVSISEGGGGEMAQTGH